MLTAELLVSALHIPASRAAAKLPFLLEAAKLAECDKDPYRLSCYVAQTAHESGRYVYRKEIWGPTKQQLRYERNFAAPWPKDSVQARLDEFKTDRLAFTLGNVNEGDGKRFMGRGDIQTTGRLNYAMITSEFRKLYGKGSPDFMTTPALLEEPIWCTLSGAIFWRKNNLNHYCDAKDFLKLTKRINGGTNGLSERMEFQAYLYMGLT